MSNNQNRLSNAISSININSYRAFKNLMNDGKLNALTDTKKTNRLLAEINDNNNSKNSTKNVFFSQIERFDWQTNPYKKDLIDKMSANVYNKYKSNSNFKRNWQGCTFTKEDDINKAIYDYNTEGKQPKKNLESRDELLSYKDDNIKFLRDENPINNARRENEFNKAKFQRSSSMVDIFNKTETNEKPFSKFTQLKFPESKIFTNEPPTPNNKGLKRFSTAKNASYNPNRGIKDTTIEIKFNNFDKKK